MAAVMTQMSAIATPCQVWPFTDAAKADLGQWTNRNNDNFHPAYRALTSAHK